METSRILVVAQGPFREPLRRLLEGAGHLVDEEVSGLAALDRVGREADLILLEDGLADVAVADLMARIQQIDAFVPIILLTPVVLAKAVARGAYLAVSPPYDADTLLVAVGRALEASRLRREVWALRSSASALYSIDQLVGDCAAMREVKSRVREAAAARSSSVLLSGEVGTGKELAATIIHRLSHRSQKPILPIACAGKTDQELESELFGHERGACPGAHDRRVGLLDANDGGAVFIDAVDDLGLALQEKLLRFVTDGTFTRLGGNLLNRADTRVLASSRRDLADLTAAGQFREDLLEHFQTMSLVMPPLRERGDDIETLARVFMDRYARELRKDIRYLSGTAVNWLRNYAWPANVRELRNVIERAVLLADGDTLDVRHLTAPSQGISTFDLPPNGLHLDELERMLVGQALMRTEGNLTRAGALLGLNRDQVRYRLEKYDLLKSGAAAPSAHRQEGGQKPRSRPSVASA